MNAKRMLGGLVMVIGLALAGCAAPATGEQSVAESSPTGDIAPDAAGDMEQGEPDAKETMENEQPNTHSMTDRAAEDTGPMEAKPTGTAEDMMDKANATPPMDKQNASPMMAEWLAAEMMDVNSGETFRIADLKGKVVLVETMAVWCSTCLRQQREVAKLHELLEGRDRLVSLALDIDPNESADVLRAHAEKHGFDWKYAIAGRAVAREIATTYGDQFINPPSAPMLVVDAKGEVHPLPFGVKSAEKLSELLEPFLAEAM